MELLQNLYVYGRKIVEKLFILTGQTLYFENHYGIKSFNCPAFNFSSDVGKLTDVKLSDVYLCFDALKDKYTHLGESLAESPHVEMMELIQQGKDLNNSRYIKNELRSCLDNRHRQANPNKLIKRHIDAYYHRENSSIPVVYKLDGKYFALDGKHRLAKAYIHGKEIIKCVEIPAYIIGEQSYTKEIYKRMKRTKAYQKHIRHFNMMSTRI